MLAIQSTQGRIENWLAGIVEICAAMLVASEVVVLLAGIVARGVFGHPLIWADELAETLFLWLAMLGATLALHRGQHMRMTALVARMAAPQRDFFDAIAVTASLLFLVLIAAPGVRWTLSAMAITTPAMEISGVWRAAAFPTGIGLMIVFAVSALLRRSSRHHSVLALGLVSAIAVGLYLLQPMLQPLG